MQVVSRSAGRSSTAGAAYRGRCCLADERTGEVHDYSRHQGLLDHAILTPARAPEWARESDSLWNAVEQTEKRKDAQLYRENILALPHELTLEQNRAMLHGFVQAHYVKRGMAAQVDIHAADLEGDQRNIHAHIMLTTRAINRNGFAEKKARNWNEKATLQAWREGWAEAINTALERHGHQERVDHRTLSEQGVFREATRHLGPAVSAMERRGEQTRAGDHNRAVEIWNREQAETAWQLSVVEAAIEAEKARMAEKERSHRTAESSQAENAKPEAEAAPDRQRFDAWAGRHRAATQTRQITEMIELDRNQANAFAPQEREIAAQYLPSLAQAERELQAIEARRQQSGVRGALYRLRGESQDRQRAQQLRQELANIRQRRTEALQVIENRKREAREALHARHAQERQGDERTIAEALRTGRIPAAVNDNARTRDAVSAQDRHREQDHGQDRGRGRRRGLSL
jgi:hypothetical protein